MAGGGGDREKQEGETMSIPINKDLEETYRNEFFKGFTLKELLCVALGFAVMAVVAVFAFLHTDLTPTVCVLVGFPFASVPFAFGFVKIQGLTLKDYLKERIYERRTVLLVYRADELPEERCMFSMTSGMEEGRKNQRRQERSGGGKMPPKLRRKLLLFAVLLCLFAALLGVTEYRRQKRREEYEAWKKQEQQEKDQQQESSQGAREPDQKVPDQKEPENGAASGEDSKDRKTVKIANLDEYAAAVMGSRAGLLEERLSSWIKESGLSADGGTILHVMVPENDPSGIAYFIRLDNAAGTIVTLTWHPAESVVTASNCSYTEEEIRNEVWEGRGPAERDIPEEEDTVYEPGRPEEALDETGGEE